MRHFCHHDTIISLVGNWLQHRRGRTFELSGPRGCRTMTSRGALASSRVMLFNRFTRRSGRGVTTGLGPSLWRKKTCQHTSDPQTFQVAHHFVDCWRSYLTLRTLQALHFPVRWLRTTENSTSSPVWSSRPSCTSFTWKNSFLLSPTSYVIKPNWEQIQNKNKLKKKNLQNVFLVISCMRVCSIPHEPISPHENRQIITWSLTHSTKARRCGTTLQAIFCPVWTIVQTWNLTSSPFCRQSALFTIPMIPKG